MKTWKLSEATEHVIQHQNNPKELDQINPEYTKLCAAVRLANDICLLKGIGVREPKEDLNIFLSPGVETLEIDETKVIEYSENILEKYQVEKDLFS